MRLAICVICYNRKFDLTRLLNCLLKVKSDVKVDLIISIDYSPAQEGIYDLIKSIEWPLGQLIIHKHEYNLGLKKHVLLCGDYSQGYDGLILLEDDLIISPHFLDYVTSALENIDFDNNIAGISLYAYSKNESTKMPFLPLIDRYDTYFAQYPSSWGFAVSKTQWKLFKDWLIDWDCDDFHDNDVPLYVSKWGKQSWKKHMIRYLVKTDKYFIYPRFSLTSNPGSDGTHHNGIGSLYSVPICLDERNWSISDFHKSKSIYDVNFAPKKEIESEITSIFNDNYYSLGTINGEDKANHIVNNYFFTPREFLKLNYLFTSKLITKILYKLWKLIK
jgi:hypothetical protein